MTEKTKTPDSVLEIYPETLEEMLSILRDDLQQIQEKTDIKDALLKAVISHEDIDQLPPEEQKIFKNSLEVLVNAFYQLVEPSITKKQEGWIIDETSLAAYKDAFDPAKDPNVNGNKKTIRDKKKDADHFRNTALQQKATKFRGELAVPADKKIPDQLTQKPQAIQEGKIWNGFVELASIGVTAYLAHQAADVGVDAITEQFPFLAEQLKNQWLKEGIVGTSALAIASTYLAASQNAIKVLNDPTKKLGQKVAPATLAVIIGGGLLAIEGLTRIPSVAEGYKISAQAKRVSEMLKPLINDENLKTYHQVVNDTSKNTDKIIARYVVAEAESGEGPRRAYKDVLTTGTVDESTIANKYIDESDEQAVLNQLREAYNQLQKDLEAAGADNKTTKALLKTMEQVKEGERGIDDMYKILARVVEKKINENQEYISKITQAFAEIDDKTQANALQIQLEKVASDMSTFANQELPDTLQKISSAFMKYKAEVDKIAKTTSGLQIPFEIPPLTENEVLKKITDMDFSGMSTLDIRGSWKIINQQSAPLSLQRIKDYTEIFSALSLALLFFGRKVGKGMRRKDKKEQIKYPSKTLEYINQVVKSLQEIINGSEFRKKFPEIPRFSEEACLQLLFTFLEQKNPNLSKTKGAEGRLKTLQRIITNDPASNDTIYAEQLNRALDHAVQEDGTFSTEFISHLYEQIGLKKFDTQYFAKADEIQTDLTHNGAGTQERISTDMQPLLEIQAKYLLEDTIDPLEEAHDGEDGEIAIKTIITILKTISNKENLPQGIEGAEDIYNTMYASFQAAADKLHQHAKDIQDKKKPNNLELSDLHIENLKEIQILQKKLRNAHKKATAEVKAQYQDTQSILAQKKEKLTPEANQSNKLQWLKEASEFFQKNNFAENPFLIYTIKDQKFKGTKLRQSMEISITKAKQESQALTTTVQRLMQENPEIEKKITQIRNAELNQDTTNDIKEKCKRIQSAIIHMKEVQKNPLNIYGQEPKTNIATIENDFKNVIEFNISREEIQQIGEMLA